MFSLEVDEVDPLYRAPLSLAIVAAAVKYVTTAWVLDDPLLKTVAEVRKEREAPPSPEVWRQILRLAFLILSANVLFKDIGLVAAAFHAQHDMLRWLHACAIIVAFSPNSVAAVAACSVAEMKLLWTRGLPLHGGWRVLLSESLAMAYGFMLCFAYMGPLLILFTTHGLLGMAVISYAFAYDFLTVPWRLMTGHMADFWVAVPIFTAALLWTCLYTSIVAGYYWLMQQRHPELAQKMRSAGLEKRILKEQMPHHVAARIIGLVRAEPQRDIEMDPMPLTAEAGETERCILNDDGLTLLCGAKVLFSISLPLVQLCVIVAAQVYLGSSAWDAAIRSFQERSWEHYLAHVGVFAKQRPLTLLWMYL